MGRVEAGGGGTRRRAMREGDVGVEAAKRVAVDVPRRGRVPPQWRREVGRRCDALLAPPRALWALAGLLRWKVRRPRARRLLLLRRRRRPGRASPSPPSSPSHLLSLTRGQGHCFFSQEPRRESSSSPETVSPTVGARRMWHPRPGSASSTAYHSVPRRAAAPAGDPHLRLPLPPPATAAPSPSFLAGNDEPELL